MKIKLEARNRIVRELSFNGRGKGGISKEEVRAPQVGAGSVIKAVGLWECLWNAPRGSAHHQNVSSHGF